MLFLKTRILAILTAVIFLVSIFTLAGCQRQSDKVSYNISKEADNFNIIRKIIVINGINNDIVFQLQGRISIETPNAKKLVITAQHGSNDYRKHYILLGDNDSVIIEDTGLGANDVSNYRYTINFNPKMWIPVDIKNID
jgi:hypothetical protein